jgi:hypothetical protein
MRFEYRHEQRPARAQELLATTERQIFLVFLVPKLRLGTRAWKLCFPYPRLCEPELRGSRSQAELGNEGDEGNEGRPGARSDQL